PGAGARSLQPRVRHRPGPCHGVTSGSEEEDNIIGPKPAKGPVESDVTKEFEHRAQRMKEKLTSADSVSWPVPRQSWMTELPPGLKSFGFGPRTVRRGADDKSGIGSVWTDTPADRERKAKVRRRPPLSMDNEETVLPGRDKRLAEQVTPYNESKRSESLLDVHQKKRPFDREQDLKVDQSDEAQKKKPLYLYLLTFLIRYEYCEIKIF
uniref:GPALPP motifs-containing protein 1 n=1 Tax=Anas platyrhynchos platyrhynchos TaxID=8840 RepID=U3I9W9_ANAPP